MSCEQIIFWAQQRRDYVRTIETVELHIKDAASFGLSRENVRQIGEFFNGCWSTVADVRPKLIEISSNAFSTNAFNDFSHRLLQSPRQAKEFLTNLTYVHISELNERMLESLKLLIQNAEKLAICEIVDLNESMGRDDTNRCITEIIDCLKYRNKIKAISLRFPLSFEQLDKLIGDLKLQIRILRFDGPRGFCLLDLYNMRNELPCVELLALQSFDRRFVDDDAENSSDQIVICPKKFFRRLEFVFCNLKALFFDWNVVDSVCLFNEDVTKNVCEGLQTLYTNLKLQFLAILIYTPDNETKSASDKIREYFENENKAEDIKVRCESFSTIENGPENFRLIFFGAYHYQARTRRMVEIVTRKRVTRPDLRHFCWILDSDNLLQPDLTLEFAGFDSKAVMKRFDQAVEFNNSILANGLADELQEDLKTSD